MVVELPILGFMIGFVILVTGSISYMIGYSHGADSVIEEMREHRRKSGW
ncbi:putative membrane protein [Bacillus phage vB_BceM_Bc431v3]|uniref:Putative membrane protein n=1 Tax=Bacillus phage vB_BceM_Bc431v3 TaxID=1195072 RepID=M4HN62_9CAUD|nr:hypothetical protein K201_gp055 [Bacillus phage vB_BceM_Bc431v3]AFQ96363.1 putative membrane protein [Bacillus phage vB_BceM_Bc431v3]